MYVRARIRVVPTVPTTAVVVMTIEGGQAQRGSDRGLLHRVVLRLVSP